MEQLLPLFERAGVEVMFTGHEHNFQHSQADGIDYFVTGAAGKVRGATPDRLRGRAHGVVGNLCHFLLAQNRGRPDDGARDRASGRDRRGGGAASTSQR